MAEECLVDANYQEEIRTWEDELKKHWDIFTEFAWIGFSAFEEETRKIGHESKVTKMKWREYLIHDLQRRHNEEVSESKTALHEKKEK